jgi:hypothetical protein
VTIFKLTTPLMRGTRELQHDVNVELKKWGVGLRIDEDDEYGRQTRQATLLVCHGLGIPKADTEHGITPEIQLKIHDPGHQLTEEERTRFEARKQWRHRLRRRFDGHGARLAVMYALDMARRHIVEHPPDSNRGPFIDKWNSLVGTPLGPQAFWCGAFVNGCLMHAGFPAQSFLAFCPFIVDHARAGTEGWSWHSVAEAIPGDLPVYREGNVAGHVGIIVASPFTTVEGNTTPDGGSGSQSNGGGVFLRHRNPGNPAFPVMGVARPPYARVGH